MKLRVSILLIITFLFLQQACNKDSPEDSAGNPTLKTETILTGYEIIWGMDFLPNGDLIFSEKRGKLFRKSNETVTEITGFPEVRNASQGGLLDVCVHPDYESNGWIYASYSASTPSGGQLKLIRFRITDNRVRNIEDIYSTDGSNTWNGHYGSRILFDNNKFLFLSVGEGGPTSYGGPGTKNNNAQDHASGWGKIHRMRDDGSVPANNPVIPGNSGPTTVYSYGHRNPQGMEINPETGEIWSSEHGPKGGDEVNIIKPGANYGWPAYSIGENYDGSNISSGRHTAQGITEPLYTWTPSIGVCGIAFITGGNFQSWKGNLLATGLASEKLYRLVVEGNRITDEVIILSNSGRVRDVVQAPDGSIYVSVEGPGRIIRITPGSIK